MIFCQIESNRQMGALYKFIMLFSVEIFMYTIFQLTSKKAHILDEVDNQRAWGRECMEMFIKQFGSDVNFQLQKITYGLEDTVPSDENDQYISQSEGQCQKQGNLDFNLDCFQYTIINEIGFEIEVQ